VQTDALALSSIDYGKSLAPIWRGRFRCDWLRCQCRVQQVANRPDAISNSKRHCRRAAQAFMHAAQIVVRDMQAHDGDVTIQIFAKAIRQPR
jgi:hypothetical protein